jgi:hypothetical protein
LFDEILRRPTAYSTNFFFEKKIRKRKNKQLRVEEGGRHETPTSQLPRILRDRQEG